MQMTDDPHNALALWNADETQWLLTDGKQYAVCGETDALQAMETTRWEMTSPEELTRAIRN